MMHLYLEDVRCVSGKYFGFPHRKKDHMKVIAKLVGMYAVVTAHAILNFVEKAKMCQYRARKLAFAAYTTHQKSNEFAALYFAFRFSSLWMTSLSGMRPMAWSCLV